MSNILIKVIGGTITSLTGFYIIQKILKSDVKINQIKTILLLAILVSITILSYQVNYYIMTPIITYASMILIYKNIFNLNILKAFIVGGIVLAIMFIADVITASIFMLFVTKEQLRGVFIYAITSNLLVASLSIGISSIKSLSNGVIKFVDKFENYSTKSSIAFMGILIVGLTIMLYYFTINYRFNLEYIINILGMASLFLLMLILVMEKNKYDKLNTEYDSLFEYVQNFEDWIEKEQLNIHESKNQLVTLQSMVKNKKAKDYINTILNETSDFNRNDIEQLKNVPKGGLKGLLYYKILLSQKEGITITTDVSPKVYDEIKKLQIKKLKDLCRLIGIYFDNAIEATKECNEKKNVSLEMYLLKGKFIIVLMNHIENEVEMKKINSKGISTKGNGRGNGLYFASKIIKNNKCFQSEQNVIRDYYVQKLIISI